MCNIICSRGWLAIRESIGLSPREFEITERISDDENESEIACELGLSRHTVHNPLLL